MVFSPPKKELIPSIIDLPKFAIEAPKPPIACPANAPTNVNHAPASKTIPPAKAGKFSIPISFFNLVKAFIMPFTGAIIPIVKACIPPANSVGTLLKIQATAQIPAAIVMTPITPAIRAASPVPPDKAITAPITPITPANTPIANAASNVQLNGGVLNVSGKTENMYEIARIAIAVATVPKTPNKASLGPTPNF